jgi:hypothetical protein
MVRKARFLVLAAPLLLAALALSGAEAQGAIHVATADDDGVQRIRIVAGEYFFKPARLTVMLFFASHRERGMEGVLEVVP